MSAKTRDSRPISRSSGAPLSDRRAVVGSSGRPEQGMVLKSGAAQVAQVLGKRDRPSGPHGQDNMSAGGGGMKFNVSDMQDKSIGRLDASEVVYPVNPSRVKPDGSVTGA